MYKYTEVYSHKSSNYRRVKWLLFGANTRVKWWWQLKFDTEREQACSVKCNQIIVGFCREIIAILFTVTSLHPRALEVATEPAACAHNNIVPVS